MSNCIEPRVVESGYVKRWLFCGVNLVIRHPALWFIYVIMFVASCLITPFLGMYPSLLVVTMGVGLACYSDEPSDGYFLTTMLPRLILIISKFSMVIMVTCAIYVLSLWFLLLTSHTPLFTGWTQYISLMESSIWFVNMFFISTHIEMSTFMMGVLFYDASYSTIFSLAAKVLIKNRGPQVLLITLSAVPAVTLSIIGNLDSTVFGDVILAVDSMISVCYALVIYFLIRESIMGVKENRTVTAENVELGTSLQNA